MYENYYDCENKCEFKFGENKECLTCNYYNDCMTEKEIAEFELCQSRALERQLSRLEDGELI